MTGLIAQHLALAVSDSMTIAEPWHHVEFASILPWRDYDLLVRDWPEANWDELIYPDQLKPDGHYRRRQQRVGNYFTELCVALESDQFGVALFEKLGYPYPDPIFPMALLIDDEAGYWIRPHVDVGTKLGTMQIYLPPDATTPEMGTRMVDKEGHKPTHQIPFLPNHGYAFKNAPHKLHEVAPGQCEHHRRSIQIIWYNSPNPGIRYV